mmetsp:Transcript_48666/g.155491  ORF Transcript_48666/g.155491 Transcript_48666/m.155491 type:complete len:300 (+) Transcript_48666:473-1372(+)
MRWTYSTRRGGMSKLITKRRFGKSWPRPSSAVETRRWRSPPSAVKRWSVSSRSAWVQPPAKPAQAQPRARSSCTTSGTVSWRLQKTRARAPEARCTCACCTTVQRTSSFEAPGNSHLSGQSPMSRKLWSTERQAASFVDPTLMWMGRKLQTSFASWSMLSGQVAEKRQTWRSGRIWLRISRTCCSKPRSRSSSASSTTTKVALRRLVRSSSSSWMRRPGVETTMSHLSSRGAATACVSAPPCTAWQRKSRLPGACAVRASTTACSCRQSSRCGTSTMPTGPSPGRSSGCARMCTSMGGT